MIEIPSPATLAKLFVDDTEQWQRHADARLARMTVDLKEMAKKIPAIPGQDYVLKIPVFRDAAPMSKVRPLIEKAFRDAGWKVIPRESWVDEVSLVVPADMLCLMGG